MKKNSHFQSNNGKQGGRRQRQEKRNEFNKFFRRPRRATAPASVGVRLRRTTKPLTGFLMLCAVSNMHANKGKIMTTFPVQPFFLLSLLLWISKLNFVHVFGLGLSVSKGRISSSSTWNSCRFNVRGPSFGGRVALISPSSTSILPGSTSSINFPKTRPLLSARLRQIDDDTRFKSSFQRRSLLRHVLPFVAGTSFVISSFTTTSEAEILQVGQCSGGIGEGCVDFSEGNDYIRSLQEKSAKNREMYAKQALDAYQLKNYPDYFSSVGRFLVKKPDGTFIVLRENELKELKKAGKISIEQPPKVLGGKITDFSRKPILVLTE